MIECIPLEQHLFEEAPIYFKKAILESDEMWSVNKKLIDTREKGLLRSIPKNFPYFSVEFGLGGGFAHVIEDETQFPPDFGKVGIASLCFAFAVAHHHLFCFLFFSFLFFSLFHTGNYLWSIGRTCTICPSCQKTTIRD